MKKTIFLSVLACFSIGVCAIGFSACQNNKNGGSSESVSVDLSAPSNGASNETSDSQNSSEEEHTHIWDKGIETVVPLCEKTGIKTFSCECGESYTEEIPAKTHNYSGAICVYCAEPQPSEGLAYTLSEDGTYYAVTGIGECRDAQVVIPSTYENLPVKEIGREAFYSCVDMTGVRLGSNVSLIGDEAFAYCGNLTDITVAKNNESYKSIGGNLYSADGTVLVQYAIGKKDRTFAISENVNAIGAFAFHSCSNLREMSVPNGVSLGESAFSHCENLVKVTLGECVRILGEYTFEYCWKLVEIYNRSSYEIEVGTDIGCVGVYAKNVYTSQRGESKVSANADGYIFYTDGDEKILLGYAGMETDLVLPDGITQVYQYAFLWDDLTSVKIPDSVKVIDYGAFCQCAELVSVDMGNGVERIAESAFFMDEKLQSVVFPKSLIYIGRNAFGECGVLKSIILSDSVQTIEDTAFNNCSSVTEVRLGSGIISVGKNAFFGANSIPYKEYENGLYLGNEENPHLVLMSGTGESLESISIHGETRVIGNQAFSYYRNLTKVDLPDEVIAIGDFAFMHCVGIKELLIPDSVNYVGEAALDGCDSLLYNEYENGVYIGSENNPYWLLLKSNVREGMSTTIHPDTKIIHSEAFAECVGLLKITIPQNVICIGENAFADCKKVVEVHNLSSLEIEKGSVAHGYVGYYAKNVYTATEGEEKLYEKNGYLLYADGDAKTLVKYVGAETELTIPEGVTELYDSAFEGAKNATSILLPESLTRIGDYAFSGCISLTDMDIPESVTYIGKYAFEECNVWEGVLTLPQIEFIGEKAFLGCKKLTSVVLGDKIAEIPYQAFYKCESLATVKGAGNLLTIGDLAFGYCASMESIELANSITFIGGGAFLMCQSLKSVTIPEKLTVIDGLFSWCESLTSVIIPENVTVIGNDAFQNCKNLSEIVILGNVTTIDYAAFYGCRALTEITLPDSVTFIGSQAFYNCVGLTEIVIPENVTEIERSAFSNCTSLANVYFEDTADWTRNNNPSQGNYKQEIASEDLADSAKAAKYLKETYAEYYWSRD